jgi:uroporphyrinogen decarboxylase
MNTRLLDALKGKNQGRPPMWLMMQAGRYLPEYRALRLKHSFLEMCHTPELIAEVTTMPLRRFEFDAAIVFSDILTIPEALGVGLRFDESVGPIIERPLRSAGDVKALPSIDIREKLSYVAKGIKLLKPTLKVPLLGFCGAPFTLASYMIEGSSSRNLHATKKWMLQDPTSFHALLDKLSDDVITSLNMQIDAGVDAVQVFDSWANVLSPSHFQEFSLKYIDKIVKAIQPKAPVIVFCKGSSVFAPLIAKIAPNAISLDWNSDIHSIRKSLPSSIALQGNLDPDSLFAPIPTLKKELKSLLTSMKGNPSYIFNLGHGILPDTPLDAVHALVDTVKEQE